MWAATCASSVVTCPIQMYQKTSRINRRGIRASFHRRGSSRIALPAVVRKEGVVSGDDAGEDSGGGADGVGVELIDAILFRQSRYLAYVFCSSPIAWARLTLDWLKR